MTMLELLASCAAGTGSISVIGALVIVLWLKWRGLQ